ncbi:hypothetical protein NBRC10513_006151 [Rhodotorula toruloides]|uniref:SPX domain-domain containing protein n=1 Tax=Rhodotorula toruloides TaxID=5286 RepID=A0A2S9ZX25_RHOTO|nr:SPX domain-domain containing protein [Rhodotorula toruloides]PRQ70302.1 SPX domain-domain containing protein [Rhodotorula toruloides]
MPHTANTHNSFARSLADQTRSALARLLSYTRNHPARTAVPDEDPAVELAPLAPSSSRARTRAPASDDGMKFSQSLLFNAVPDWLNNYIAYDALKAQIYKFEKQAVLQQQHAPPTSYRDEETDLEHAGEAGGTKEENERVFVKLLDKELNKITDFYVSKERELLGDLQLLKEDLERLREEEEESESASRGGAEYSDDEDLAARQHRTARRRRASSHGAGGAGLGTSGGSDSEEGEDEEGDEEGQEGDERKKGDLARLLNDPREYSEAARAGRRNARRPSTSGSRAAGAKGKSKRGRALSSASETGDLLGLHDGDEDEADQQEPVTPSRRRPSLGQRNSHPSFNNGTTPANRSLTLRTRRSLANRMMTGSFLTDGEDSSNPQAWDGLSDWAIDTRIMFKRRLASLFTSLSELKQFVDLNYTGFRKVIKKYDKITNSDLRQRYMSTIVDHTFPFERTTQQRLQAGVQEIVPLYADLATGGDADLALKQLKAHLREHVVWERNTVWREMIGLERRGWGAAGSGGRRAGGAFLGAGMGNDLPLVQPASPPTGLESKIAEIPTPLGRVRVPWWINSQSIAAALAIGLFVFILSGEWFDRVEEQNCLALLAVVTIFWALEIMPLFVTALMVPFLVVVLRVLRSTDGLDRRLTSVEATKYIFSQMFSPTLMLLLGGFTLAAALSKQNIDKVLATKVLSFAGTKPRSVLFAYMLVACFASMWISNVAAPVLCYSLIQPILRTLPSKSPFSKALILGIALASNIGGMASPISSPQNLIALEYMNPPISWIGWFSVSIPVSFTSVVCIWLILLWSYRAGGSNVVINPVRVNKEPFTKTQWAVSAVTIATIVLWCVESKLAWLFGDMGIIAILPIVAFYGSGVLRKADFDHSPWSIVFLAMGGIALGKAVLSSGLLDDIDSVIQQAVLGMDVWPILALFGMLVLVLATFISHTIAAVLIVPIAAQIGDAMKTPHSRLLVFATSLICSAGMGLPVSGFPNLQAINQEDELGQRYLDPRDFYVNGLPASVVATVIIVTLGYVIMRLIGL